MLGQEFRKLRKNRHMTLDEVSRGITSKSHLSRWELGKDQISVEILLKLLNRIQVRPDDFFNPDNLPLNVFLINIAKLYSKHDVNGLGEIVRQFLNYYRNGSHNKTFLFRAAIADNYYKDLSNDDLFTEKEKAVLWLRFSNLKNWYQEDILFFGNSLYVLSNTEIYSATRSLLSFTFEQNNVSSRVINTVLNAIFALIKNKDCNKAAKLLKIVEDYFDSISDSMNEMLYERTRITFMKMLLQYIKDPSNEKDFEQFLFGLKTAGLGERAASYEETWKQIKKVYQC